MVDVVVNFGRAADIFETAPEFHEDVLVIRGYNGLVELGWVWDGDSFVPVSQAELDANAAKSVRQVRETVLTSVVDPLVSNPLRWAELTDAKQAEWAAYRQALLDISEQSGFPHDVIWPTKP